MKNIGVLLAVALNTVLAVGSAKASNVYFFKDFGDFDRDGWSFAGGFIELADYEGSLTADNFQDPGAGSSVVLDYSATFSSPFNGGATYTLTPANSVLRYDDIPSIANFQVDNATINHPGPANSSQIENMRILSGPGGQQRVEFATFSGRGALNLVDLNSLGLPGGGNAVSRVPLPFAFASVVPEPNASVLAVAAFCPSFSRRRRASTMAYPAFGAA